jgi:hypothetical protein
VFLAQPPHPGGVELERANAGQRPGDVAVTDDPEPVGLVLLLEDPPSGGEFDVLRQGHQPVAVVVGQGGQPLGCRRLKPAPRTGCFGGSGRRRDKSVPHAP